MRYRLTIGSALVAWALIAAPGVASAASTSPPTINGFSPKQGPVGTTVTITGKHFGAPGLQVAFGGTAAVPDSVTGTKIIVRVPPLAPTGSIQVKTRYGTAVSAASFRVTKGIASFPQGAWPGQNVTIAASGMPAFHDFTLKLDGAAFGGVATNSAGQFSLVRTLPGDLTIGPEHILSAFDSISQVQFKIHIWIFGNWPQARNDAAQSGTGTAEFLIDTSNVWRLNSVHGWSGSLSSPAVEDYGNLFLGRFDGVMEIGNYASSSPTLPWGLVLDGAVTQSPAVDNGVVYSVTDDKLYAIPESGSSILWSTPLGAAAHPFAPVVADGRIYVATGGTGTLQVFDESSGTPLWSNTFTTVFGPPAVDAKSGGGSGDVYVSVRNGGINKVIVRTGSGAVVGGTASLSSTSLSGPSLAAGRIIVSGWSSATSTSTLYALDATTLSLLWNSNDIGGSGQPTAVAVGNGHVFLQNAAGILYSFKSSGCGSATCNPLWKSVNYGLGGTTPPTLANGVVYMAAGLLPAPNNESATIRYLDANGCGSATCPELFVTNMASYIHGQMTVVAGTLVFMDDSDSIEVAELP